MRVLKEDEDTAIYQSMCNGFPHSLCILTQFLLPLLSCLSMRFFPLEIWYYLWPYSLWF